MFAAVVVAYRNHPLSSGVAPDWATAWGQDKNGVFVGFTVADIDHTLRWIPPGRFMMGSPKNEAGRRDREIQHVVELTEGFWLGEIPVTQRLYEAVTGKNPSKFSDDPMRPVEKVSWDDAQAFLRATNELCPGLNLSLPTEAQWEYGCRAGTRTATYAGDLDLEGIRASVLNDIAWYHGNANRKTHPVGLKDPNPWGVYDMLGNVREWCSDFYGEYSESPATNPLGPSEGASRVIRGGSWPYHAQFVRAARRDGRRPSRADSSLGFRVSRGQVR